MVNAKYYSKSYIITLNQYSYLTEVDVANLLGENSVHIESLETVSVRVATCSGNITTKNLKGNHICLLSQSGKINCKSSSQGRIIIQSGNGVLS